MELCLITNIYNIILLQWDIRVVNQNVNLIIRKTSQMSVFKFPSIGELRQKLLQNIPRKFDKINQSTRVCIKYFEDKDVHSFNIHTNPDGTTYTVSDVALIKLFYCAYMHYYQYKKYVNYCIIITVMLWSGVGSY